MADMPFKTVTKANKATLIIKSPKGATLHTMTCHFNPDKYVMSRGLEWGEHSLPDSNTKVLNYKGVGDDKLSLNLVFDTTQEGKDVRKITEPLWEASFINEPKNSQAGTGEPCRIVFIWGPQMKKFQFEGVIEKMTQTFIFFKPDGTPVRAKVDLSLMKAKDPAKPAGQNPTSGAIPGKVHIVEDGDRLDLIANQYYSRPGMWREIADYNGIDNPRNLKPGLQLILPEIS